MRLHELKKNDEFTAVVYNRQTDEEINISGKFLGMDGMYGKVMLYGTDTVSYFMAMMEVEKENK